jgi:hypothetical protein
MANLGRHEPTRQRLRLTVSRERWDRSKGLQQVITVTFVLSSLGAVGNWYNWLRGASSVPFPVALTVVAVLTFALTPRRWGLLVMSASGVFGLEVLALALHKGPLRLTLEAMAVTAMAAGLFQYVRMKVEAPRSEQEPHGPTGTRE